MIPPTTQAPRYIPTEGRWVATCGGVIKMPMPSMDPITIASPPQVPITRGWLEADESVVSSLLLVDIRWSLHRSDDDILTLEAQLVEFGGKTPGLHLVDHHLGVESMVFGRT